MQQADLAVYIGRFQPFHLGHAYAVQRGLELAKNVLVLTGTTGGPRTIKNPWTADERYSMIEWQFPKQLADGSLTVDEILDYPHSDTEWIAGVLGAVRFHYPEAKKIILIGHDKDASSYYLKMFPQWKFVDTGYEQLQNGHFAIDATQIRQQLFNQTPQYIRGLVHEHTFNYLSDCCKKDAWFQDLITEHKFIQKYRDSWKAAPFPPIFVTTEDLARSSTASSTTHACVV